MTATVQICYLYTFITETRRSIATTPRSTPRSWYVLTYTRVHVHMMCSTGILRIYAQNSCCTGLSRTYARTSIRRASVARVVEISMADIIHVLYAALCLPLSMLNRVFLGYISSCSQIKYYANNISVVLVVPRKIRGNDYLLVGMQHSQHEKNSLCTYNIPALVCVRARARVRVRTLPQSRVTFSVFLFFYLIADSSCLFLIAYVNVYLTQKGQVAFQCKRQFCGISFLLKKKCFWCNKPAETKCTGCLSACFCSKQCQTSSWPEHKKLCNLVTESSITTEDEVVVVEV